MQNSVAWRNGVWLPARRATIALDDLGFMQGAVAVDRLRTFGGRAVDIAEHVHRFEHSCQALHIQLPRTDELVAIVEACVHHNLSRTAEPDFSVVLLATPGRVGAVQGQATLIVHPMAIPWERLAAWYRDGQTLAVSTHRQVPADCWSPHIKTRCRLHYYLADRQVDGGQDKAHAAAVLLNSQGYITETAAANLLVVEGQNIVSPRRESILWGISLQRSLCLAQRRLYGRVCRRQPHPRRPGRCHPFVRQYGLLVERFAVE